MKTCTVKIVMFGSTRTLRWNNIWARFDTKTLSLEYQSPRGPIKSSHKNQGQTINTNVSCVTWRWTPRFNSFSTCGPSDIRQRWRVNLQNQDGSHMNDSESNKDYKLSWWVETLLNLCLSLFRKYKPLLTLTPRTNLSFFPRWPQWHSYPSSKVCLRVCSSSSWCERYNTWVVQTKRDEKDKKSSNLKSFWCLHLRIFFFVTRLICRMRYHAILVTISKYKTVLELLFTL